MFDLADFVAARSKAGDLGAVAASIAQQQGLLQQVQWQAAVLIDRAFWSLCGSQAQFSRHTSSVLNSKVCCIGSHAQHICCVDLILPHLIFLRKSHHTGSWTSMAKLASVTPRNFPAKELTLTCICRRQPGRQPFWQHAWGSVPCTSCSVPASLPAWIGLPVKRGCYLLPVPSSLREAYWTCKEVPL